MENCIFCKIAAGEIPAITLFEDEDLKAIFDAGPATKGHTLIIPKKHYANVYEMPEELLAKAHITAKKVGTILKELTKCDGLNILQNNGEMAGQSVFHFHIHVIPRYKGDTANISWPQQEQEKEWLTKLADEVQSRM